MSKTKRPTRVSVVAAKRGLTYRLEEDGLLENVICRGFVKQAIGRTPRKIKITLSSEPVRGFREVKVWLPSWVVGGDWHWRHLREDGEDGYIYRQLHQLIVKLIGKPKSALIKRIYYKIQKV